MYVERDPPDTLLDLCHLQLLAKPSNKNVLKECDNLRIHAQLRI